MKCKEVLRSNGIGGTVATLDDGRCALVYLEENGFFIEVLVDTFFKWGAFDREPTEEEIEKSIKIINESGNYEESNDAIAYREDEEFREETNMIKKQMGYNY